MTQHEGRQIGADAKEQAVAKTDQAEATDQDVQAQGEHTGDQDFDRELGLRAAREMRQRDGD